MGSNNQSDEWSGHEPFDGTEDSAFTEEDGGSDPKHGIHSDVETLYDIDPDLQDYRDERLQSYRDECVNVTIWDSSLEALADLDAKIKFAKNRLDADPIDNPDQTNSYGRLLNDRNRILKMVEWEEQVDREQEAARTFADLVARNSNEDGDTNE